MKDRLDSFERWALGDHLRQWLAGQYPQHDEPSRLLAERQICAYLRRENNMAEIYNSSWDEIARRAALEAQE